VGDRERVMVGKEKKRGPKSDLRAGIEGREVCPEEKWGLLGSLLPLS